jgi:isocitrate/isopropylmalate dehydrogenase
VKAYASCDSSGGCNPQRFDVIVLPSLYGSSPIWPPASSAASGSHPAAATYPYFEPAHGTAPDIAGTGTINPTATLLSATMMLDHLGQTDTSRAVVAALEAVYAAGTHLTPDQGGTATAVQFCDAVEAAPGRPPTPA